MTLKATWLWNGSANNGRTAFGFSETWYTDDAPAVLLPKMQELAIIRAQILAKPTFLFGYRIQDVAANSRAYTQPPAQDIASGQRAGTPNIPQDAALCYCLGTVGGTFKRFWLHNLWDDLVDDMAFVGQRVFQVAFNWVNGLADNGFKFRYVVQSAPTVPIMSISPLGVVRTREPLTGVGVGSLVQLYHVRGVDGRGKRGKFAVAARTDDSNFTLANYAGGEVGMSGKIRLVQYAYTSIQRIPNDAFGRNPVVRPGARKCGRPFGALRGRAVARR